MNDFDDLFTTALLTVIASLSLGCFFFGGGGDGGGGGPTGNCESDPATDPGKVNTGNLEAELGHRQRSSPDPMDVGTDDAGVDAGYSSFFFEPLDDDNPSYNRISAGGVQGSSTVHISPAVLVRNPGSPDSDAMVNFQVRDPDSGEVLTHTACDKGTLELWEKVPDGRMFGGMRVIFNIPRDRVAGTQQIIADVQIGNRRKVLKRTIDIE